MSTLAHNRLRHYESGVGLALLLMGAIGIYLTHDDAFWERFAILRGGKSIATLSKMGGALRIKSPNTMSWHWIVQDKTELLDNDLIHTEATGSGEIQFNKDISFELWPNSLIQVRAAEMGKLTVPKILSGRIKVRVSPKTKEAVLHTENGPLIIRPKVVSNKPVEVTLSVRNKDYAVTDSNEPIEVSIPKAEGAIRTEVAPKATTDHVSNILDKPKLILPANHATILANSAVEEGRVSIRFEWSNTSEAKNLRFELRNTNNSTVESLNVTNKEEVERKLTVGLYDWRVIAETEPSEWRSFQISNDSEKKSVSSLEEKYSEPAKAVKPIEVSQPKVVKTIPKSITVAKPVQTATAPARVPATPPRQPAGIPKKPSAPQQNTAPAGTPKDVDLIFYP